MRTLFPSVLSCETGLLTTTGGRMSSRGFRTSTQVSYCIVPCDGDAFAYPGTKA